MMWKFFQRAARSCLARCGPSTIRGCWSTVSTTANVHDLGFIFLNTYLPWYELTAIRACATCWSRRPDAGPALHGAWAISALVRLARVLFIDIMMNVPLIFYAAELDRRCATGANRPGPLAHHPRHDSCEPTDRRRMKGSSILPMARSFASRRIRACAPNSPWARGLAWSSVRL